jgi:hypothetical protein
MYSTHSSGSRPALHTTDTGKWFSTQCMYIGYTLMKIEHETLHKTFLKVH